MLFRVYQSFIPSQKFRSNISAYKFNAIFYPLTFSFGSLGKRNLCRIVFRYSNITMGWLRAGGIHRDFSTMALLWRHLYT